VIDVHIKGYNNDVLAVYWCLW